MASEFKGTKDPVSFDRTVTDQTGSPCVINQVTQLLVAVVDNEGGDEDENAANGELFAEAINVLHTTGKTPHELAGEVATLAERVKVLEAERDELAKVIGDFIGIVGESTGIIGWHLNGDVLPWDQCDFVADMESILARANQPAAVTGGAE